MDDTAKTEVEDRTAKAIGESPYEDIREVFRDRLRWLKEQNPSAFAQALAYYNDTLVRNISQGEPALLEWLRYGWRLGELSGAGKLFAIDESGRAIELEDVKADGSLLLHLPNETNIPALPLATPRHLSPHQKATLDLLVRRKLSLE